jgi:hypothetical protein
MAITYFCGKFGSILIDGVSYPMSNWELSSEVSYPEITNWSSVSAGGPIQMFCPNIVGGTITCEGFLSSAGLPTSVLAPPVQFPTAGSYGEFFLGYGPALGFTVSGLIVNITPSTDVSDVARFSIEAVISLDPASL